MAISGCNNYMKDSEQKVPGPGYNYSSQAFDMNLHSSSGLRGKTDSDVSVLVACKVQLSSEVIRWKTESLRLQKERDAAQQKAKELDHTVSSMSDKIKDMESQLLKAEEVKNCLKQCRLAQSSEKAALAQKLSNSFSKHQSRTSESCHSFPWSDSKTNSLNPETTDESDSNEDWREVSHRMLAQMRREMDELKSMNFTITATEKSTVAKSLPSEEISTELIPEEIEKEISSMETKTVLLKEHMLKQRGKLKWLKNMLEDGEASFSSNVQTSTEIKNTESPCNSSAICSPESKAPLVDGSPHFCNDPQHRFRTNEGEVSSSGTCEQNVEISELRVCPICQTSFGPEVEQNDFEEHVFNHLEAESASLLEQYVVV